MSVNGRPENSTYGVSVAAVLKQIRAAAASEDATRSAPTEMPAAAVLLVLLGSPDHTGDTDVSLQARSCGWGANAIWMSEISDRLIKSGRHR